ncbi:MAG: FHA domain-containing protein, partial [Candidatus Xenobia bacterium]
MSEVATNPVQALEIRAIEGFCMGARHMVRQFPVTVGRGAEADVRLLDDPADPTISRLHIRIQQEAGRFSIVDTSTNGTWLDEVRLEHGCAVPLPGGSTLRLGPRTRLQIVMTEAAEVAEPAGPTLDLRLFGVPEVRVNGHLVGA